MASVSGGHPETKSSDFHLLRMSESKPPWWMMGEWIMVIDVFWLLREGRRKASLEETSMPLTVLFCLFLDMSSGEDTWATNNAAEFTLGRYEEDEEQDSNDHSYQQGVFIPRNPQGSASRYWRVRRTSNDRSL